MKAKMQALAFWMRRVWNRDPFLVCALSVGIGANLLPLIVSRYLPFTDISGHMGLIGALVHRNEPAARIPDFFIIDIRLIPSILYSCVTWALSSLMGLPEANNVYMAFLCVLGMPLSMVYALHSFGRDPRLALLSLPLIYHRCLWFGFASYAGAVPMIIAGLAVLNDILKESRGLGFARWWRVALLAALSILIVAAHAFAALAFFGLSLVLLMSSWPTWRGSIQSLGGLVPGLIYVVAWIKRSQGPSGNQNLIQELLASNKTLKQHIELFYQWTIHGLKSGVDDWVLGFLCGGLLLSLVWTVINRRSESPTRHRLWTWRPMILLLVVMAMFALLPMEISNPPWWAVCVRMVSLAWLFAILALPRAGRRTPAWVVAPALAAGVFYGCYLAYDFRTWFRDVEMAGFDEALDDIPPGVRVHAIWPDFGGESHYAHFPFAHFGTFYTVRRGGLAVPMMDGTKEVWVLPKPRPPHGGWSQVWSVTWAKHGQYWDYFLVKANPPGAPAVPPPMRDAPAGALEKVSTHGLWTVYRRAAGF